MRPALTPGIVLDGRYRLEDRVSVGDGDEQWRARDSVLARSVAVRCLRVGQHRTGAVVAAARAGASVPDHRFQRVLDAVVDGEHVFLVTEWLPATDLGEVLLSAGPVEPSLACRIATELAEALACAHERGLAHVRLRPESILLTDTGRVMIAGLGVDAAAAGTRATGEAAAAADIRSLGAVLYACLTGHWPLAEPPSAIPPALQDSGRAWHARRIRAGVPSGLDEVADRALVGTLRTPAEVLAALDGTTGHGAAAGPDEGIEPAEEPAPDAGVPSRRWVALPAVALVGAATMVAWQLVSSPPGPGSGGPAVPSPPRATTSAAVEPLDDAAVVPIAGVRYVDPTGTVRTDVGLAADGDLSTVWHTATYYGDPHFGRLKPGVGLLLDLGSRRRVRTVSFTLEGRGTDLTLYAGDSPASSPQGYQPVARAVDAGPTLTLRPAQAVAARYLLVWLTSLPPVSPGAYQAGIAEVVVRR